MTNCPGVLPSDPDAFNAKLDSLVAARKLTDHDANAVRDFKSFLEAIAPHRDGPLPLSILREHQRYLMLSDVEIEELERNRGSEG
jgi:hypothetical protein